MELTPCITDEDFEACRAVRMTVVPGERCDTVAELRAQDSPTRLLMLASTDGSVVGSGMADRSETTGGAFATARVLPEHRRRGVGSAILHALADHCSALGLPELRASVDDEGSLAFAHTFGFVEVDRQVEQVRTVRDEPAPAALPPGVSVIELSERPEIWAECYDTFGVQVLSDFAVFEPLDISPERWNSSWAGDPMFLALHGDEVIGCAGVHRDSDQPQRGENALTAVRRDWRGRGVAAHLKRRTLQWAAANGLVELYTWTQARNRPMLTLNEQLGYLTRQESITLARPLPLDARTTV